MTAAFMFLQLNLTGGEADARALHDSIHAVAGVKTVHFVAGPTDMVVFVENSRPACLDGSRRQDPQSERRCELRHAHRSADVVGNRLAGFIPYFEAAQVSDVSSRPGTNPLDPIHPNPGDISSRRVFHRWELHPRTDVDRCQALQELGRAPFFDPRLAVEHRVFRQAHLALGLRLQRDRHPGISQDVPDFLVPG